jgi:cytochrome P450
MIGYLLLAPLLLIAAFYVYMKIKEYQYVQRVYNVKTKETLWHPSIFNFINALAFGDKTRSLIIQNVEQSKGHGPINLGWMLFFPTVVVKTPELAMQVLKNTKVYQKQDPIIFKEGADFLGRQHLVLVNGNAWHRQRKVLEPAFGSALHNYENIFASKTKIVLGKFNAEGGVISNTNQLTQEMALDILGLSIFGFDFDSLQGKSKKDLNAYNTLMHTVNSPPSYLYYFLKEKLMPWSSNPSLQAELDVFNDLCSRLIEESKNSQSKTFSMLDLMVASQNTDDGLTDVEIRDNMSIFFLAGHETTANALGFALYTLAEHPDIQVALRDTIRKEVEGKTDWKYEDIKGIEDLNCFIKENMRMWPPLAIVPAKKTSEDTVLGDIFIPKDHLVSINIWAIHRSDEVYEDANTFKPNRWKKEESRKYPNGSWIPFSGGPRICIGNDFSLMEQRIFLAEFLLNFSVSKVNPKDVMDVDPSSALFQSPKSYPLKYEKISK